ncbi:MAG: SdrD B-like domain-containing protein [Candidatus Gottesmanbacteria bacterium]
MNHLGKDKVFAWLSVFSLTLQILNGVFLFSPIYAQEQTPQSSPDTMVTPSPSVEQTSNIEVTPIPDVSPTPEITPEPSPSLEPTPVATPDVTPIPDTTVSPNNQPEAPPSAQALDQTQASPEPGISPSISPLAEPDKEDGHISAAILKDTKADSIDLIDLDFQAEGSAVINTDKLDYAPTDTVLVTGTGFLPDKTYTIEITSQDLPAVAFNAEVKSDSAGNLFYSYQLDGNYRPNYKVEIKRHTEIIASTTFTDSVPFGPTSSQNIACMGDQPTAPSGLNCTANDIQIASVDNIHIVASGPDPAHLTPTASTECDYPGQYIQFTASWHVESTATSRYNVGLWFANQGQTNALHGMCSASTLPSSPNPPFFEDTDDTCGDIHSGEIGTVTPDITVIAQCNAAPGTNQLSLPYCTSWDQNERAGNGCNNPSGTVPGTPSKCSCDNGFTVPIIVPPSIEVVKSLSPSNDPGLFNLLVNTVTKKTDAGNGGTTGKVGITLGSNSFGETAGTGTNLNNYTSVASCVLRGTQTAVSASQSGNTWTIANITNGQDILCTITNTRINNASITIVKDAQPNNSQDFPFTTTGSGLSSFSLDDDSDPTLSNTKVFTDLGSGIYTVTEGVVSGWTTSQINCVDPTQNSSGNLPTAPVATINLAAGESVTCTFINTRDQGTIELKKVWSGTGGQTTLNIGTTPAGNDTDTQLTGVDGVAPLTTGQNQVNTGTYYMSEAGGLGNYSSSALSCFNDANNNGTNDGESNVTVGINNSVVVGTGQHVICSFTNTRNTGTIKVIKDVSPDDQGATSWDFAISGPTNNSATLVDGGQSNAFTSDTGNYTVTETAHTGTNGSNYNTTYSCSVVTNEITHGSGRIATFALATNQNVVCTFTNALRTGHIIVDKITVPSGDAQSFTFATTGTGYTGFSLTDVSTPNDQELLIGNYSVTETGVNGWTLTNTSCVSSIQDTETANNLELDAGETITCTFTNTKKGSITACKYNDVNGNGVINQGDDQLLDGWEMTLNPGNIKQSTVNGCTTFSNLLPDNYSIIETLQPDWSNTSGGLTQNISLTAGENSTVNFLNFELGDITVCKYNDYNGNGQYEPQDDLPLSNISINLFQAINLLDTKSTGLNGCVTFNGLTAGQYRVAEDYNDPDLLGYYSTNNITHYDVNIVSGSQENRIFLNTQYRTISGTKYHDLNNNGARDAGEPGLENWTIFIDYNNNNVLDAGEPSTTTNVNGYYEFTNLAADSYTIAEGLKPGWNQTQPSTGHYDVDVHTAVTSTGNDFGNRGALSIFACKFEDSNGLLAGGNFTPVTNWDFTLGQQTQNTGSGHCTTFSNLIPGGYTVSEPSPLPNGWFFADDSQGSRYVVLIDQNKTVNFFNYRKGSITGQKFNDLNGNGSKNGGESGLPGWTIHLLDTNDNVLQTTLTDASGNFIFTNLDPGTYRIREVGQTSWLQKTTNPIDIVLSSNQAVTDIDFGNQGRGMITVYKNVDTNGDGQVENTGVTNWTWDITAGEQNIATGQTRTLTAGNYTISEDQQANYHIVDLTCGQTSLGAIETTNFDLNPGQEIICTFTNARDTGTVIVHKLVDSNSDNQYEGGDDDANKLGFRWSLNNENPATRDMGTNAQVTTIDSHLINENNVPGYVFTGWFSGEGTCGDLPANQLQLPVDISLIRNGQSRSITLCNQLQNPILTITKSNNAGGDKNPGDNVLFTLTVTATQSAVNNVIVYDLPAGGFKYRSGSWTANSNVHGVLSIPEPNYTSSGKWILGNMAKDETITLTYLADIDSGQQPGLYKDLAWATGKSLSDTDVLALAVNPGYWDTNYVGTQVNIVKEQQSGLTVNVEGNKEEQVLGASTQLPATGAQSKWLIAALLLLILGLVSIISSTFMKKGKKHLFLIAILFVLMNIMLAGNVLAASLTVRIEEPKTPTNQNNFKINFVTLDIAGRVITANCFVKGPSDAGFSQFGPDISLPNGGNNGNCNVDSTIVNNPGTYQFYVRASVTGDPSQDSQIVSTEYQNSIPGNPANYQKTKNLCTYHISFKTADDGGKTVKVELYRSENTTFNVDSGSRVQSMALGSNTEGSFDDSPPDCSKTYYYGVRAFDSFGNGSGFAGDSFTTTTTVTIAASPSAASGAIPISGAVTGSVVGGGTGEEVVGATPGSEIASPAPGTTAEGQVQGVQATQSGLLNKKNLAIFAGIIIVLGLLYYFYRRNQA